MEPWETEAISDCGKTFLGWFIPEKNTVRSNWSCFYGIKHKNERKADINNKFNFLQIEISMQNKNKINENEHLEEYIKRNIERAHEEESNIFGNLNNDDAKNKINNKDNDR